MLCLGRGYDSSAHFEFWDSLRILENIGDTRHIPVVRMHLAQSRIGVALYEGGRGNPRRVTRTFRERGDTTCEDEALRLLATIQDERKRWFTRPDSDNPALRPEHAHNKPHDRLDDQFPRLTTRP